MSVAAIPSPVTTQRMHFTLGDLFRGLTVCAFAMFVAVQFNPLIASRAVGVGLAIGLGILAWQRRSSWRWLGAVALVVISFAPTLFAAGVPFSHRDMVCYECGCSRDTHEVWGWKTEDRIEQNEVSRWAAPLLPDDHVHAWSVTSSHYRSSWFGGAPIACGGHPEGAYLAWNLARLGRQQEAEAFYREYCDIRHGRSTKPMKQFNAEASAALDAAIKARNP